MDIIIFSDVFGITPALNKLKDQLGANSVVDPYEGKSMGFDNEADAYSYFIAEVGLDVYVSRVLKALASLKCTTNIIGFSVGASAIWRISQRNHCGHINQAVCFYGSQIRHSTKITPCFKIQLVFPKKESHFDVSELIVKLENKNNVEITQVEYLHGFMNSHSDNYNEEGYIESMAVLKLMPE